MLEAIKQILNLQTDEKDSLIQYYINVFTQKILNYTGQIELPTALEHIVVEKVVNKLNNNNVKSIQRGDTRIEYVDVKEEFTESEIMELNKFRRVRLL